VENHPDLLGLRLTEFLDALAAGEPAPGGGSAAALAVAMAAALARSVARQSRDVWPDAGGVIAQAEALGRRVAPLADRDARAYEEALRTIAERGAIAAGARDAKLAEVLGRAAEAPLEIGQAAADAAELAAEAAEHGAPDVRADAVAGALLAEGAARIAATLVRINLGPARNDPRVGAARALEARAAAGSERARGALAS
jgi:formiminotetrahydrofolate cyclodeaminase